MVIDGAKLPRAIPANVISKVTPQPALACFNPVSRDDLLLRWRCKLSRFRKDVLPLDDDDDTQHLERLYPLAICTKRLGQPRWPPFQLQPQLYSGAIGARPTVDYQTKDHKGQKNLSKSLVNFDAINQGSLVVFQQY